MITKVTKDMTIGEILRVKPGKTHMLMSYGICNCCGGNLTIEESAKAKNLDIEKILAQLNKA